MAVTIIIVLCIGFAFMAGMYLLVESETSNPTVMDRDQAEQAAKKQGGLDREHETDTDRPTWETTRESAATGGETKQDSKTEPSAESQTGWEFDRE
ncbi:hypothetical protein [Natrialba sp. PRR66]|uniref:hypothetical protein n=1 Tax=Natrialba sp. PRR66 TaxID=3098146 RepID=UPI002B1DD1C2|nr:hypothetical protein [Natrialba sp. PRR66]